MRILNIGCGFVRPQHPPFINIDTLRSQLPEGQEARIRLNQETNYVDHDIINPLPFPDNETDGVFASHTLEHFDAQTAVRILSDCRRALKPGGVVCMSVPNAGYFRSVFPQDNKENCRRLFGEPIPAAEPKSTFLEYALFFSDHKQVFTEDSLWCTFVAAGFNYLSVSISNPAGWHACQIRKHFLPLANRFEFSIFMEATK